MVGWTNQMCGWAHRWAFKCSFRLENNCRNQFSELCSKKTSFSNSAFEHLRRPSQMVTTASLGQIHPQASAFSWHYTKLVIGNTLPPLPRWLLWPNAWCADAIEKAVTADVQNITQREDRACISRDDSDTRPTPAGGVSNVSEHKEWCIHSAASAGKHALVTHYVLGLRVLLTVRNHRVLRIEIQENRHAFNNTRNSRSEKIAEQFNESGMRLISKQSGS